MKQRDGAGGAKAIYWPMSTLCGGMSFKVTAPKDYQDSLLI